MKRVAYIVSWGVLGAFFCLVVDCSKTVPTATVADESITSSQPANQNSPSSDIQIRTGFVSDEPAAIEIAVKAWILIYGQDQIEEEKPYRADLKNGVWTVTGSLPRDWDGGVAIARISQKDGRILKIGHGK